MKHKHNRKNTLVCFNKEQEIPMLQHEEYLTSVYFLQMNPLILVSVSFVRHPRIYSNIYQEIQRLTHCHTQWFILSCSIYFHHLRGKEVFDVNTMAPFISPCHQLTKHMETFPATSTKERVRDVQYKRNPMNESCQDKCTSFSSTFTQGKAYIKIMQIFWFKQSGPNPYWDQMWQIFEY